MNNHKQIYEVPLYAYLHLDNTWTYSDYIKIESETKPKVVRKVQHSIDRDEDDNPLIKFILVYDAKKINLIESTNREECNEEQSAICVSATEDESVIVAPIYEVIKE